VRRVNMHYSDRPNGHDGAAGRRRAAQSLHGRTRQKSGLDSVAEGVVEVVQWKGP
jgi:hypothetical protein